MSFSKAVLLVVLAVLLISAEVSALRDLAEIKTTPTTHGGGAFNRGTIGGHTGNRGPVFNKPPPKNCNNVYTRDCSRNQYGGKGGGGAPGPKTR